MPETTMYMLQNVLYPCKGCPYQEGFFHGELENYQSNEGCRPAVKRHGCEVHAASVSTKRGSGI
jgi:hypothetical protein